MPERTTVEFVNIAQPIVEEYRSGIMEVLSKFNKSVEEKLSDMTESEAILFYAMMQTVQKEINKME